VKKHQKHYMHQKNIKKMKLSSSSLAQNQTKNKKDEVRTKSNEKNDAKKKNHNTAIRIEKHI